MTFIKKCTVAVSSQTEFLFYQQKGGHSFIIRTALLSRMGKMTVAQADELIKFISSHGEMVIIEWDILMEQVSFEQASARFSEWLNDLQKRSTQLEIRVQDLGAMYWIKNNYPHMKIQLNLETGHRNLPSIKKHICYLGEQLSRIMLSFELSKDKLQLYQRELNVPIEILFHGRIPLFYSPRKLLSPLDTNQEQDNWIERDGESEESPHKGFPIIENRHGTFMFNVKELSLVDVYSELAEIGIDYLRVDLNSFEEGEQFKWFEQIELVLDSSVDFTQFKREYPAEIIRGFYSVNKSSVLFEKLKNKFLQHDDETYIGDVIEVSKPRHIAVQIKRGQLLIGSEIFYMTPEGKRIEVIITSILNSQRDNIDVATKGDIVFLPYKKSLSAKSTVNQSY